MVTVQNISDTPIENWHIAFSEIPQIQSLWGAQLAENGQGETAFKNMGWNQDIDVGSSVSFGFTTAESFEGFPEIAELAVSKQTVSERDYDIAYQVTNGWGTGYTAALSLRNISDRAIEDWLVSFDLPCEIDDIWNGQILSHTDGRYVIKNKTDNQNIAAGQTLQIGFTVNAGDAAIQPEHILVEQYTLAYGSAQSGNGSEENSDKWTEDGTDSGHSDDGIEEEVSLKINTDSFDLNEALEMYLTQDKVDYISGTLKGAEKVESMTYAITDLNGLAVKNGVIRAQKNWKTPQTGLVLGLNIITVTAVCKDREALEQQIFLMNFNMDNMENTDISLADTDGDGIKDYFETFYGTDPLMSDTDGDGLTDWQEIILTGTAPLLIDTDENGVTDDREDFDEDGLTNQEEMTAGTNVFYPDTDGDGLDDGKEISRYHTDPLVADTDEDGLADGADVKLGFDPLKPDTDGNSVLDGDEVVYQTYTKMLDPERKAGITQVSVSMDCAGYIDDQVLIQNTYNLDMRSTDVVGLFGAPVAIETENEFDEAVITFTYDEAELGEISEDNLRIMWYDRENDIYSILDDETVLDKENHTLSCTTTHFSTWMVVDRSVWWAEWKKDLGYTELLGNQEYHYAIWRTFNCFDTDPVPIAILKEYKWLFGMGYVYQGVQYLSWPPESYKAIAASTNIKYEIISPETALENSLLELINLSYPAMDRVLLFCNKEDVKYDPNIVRIAKENGVKIIFISSHGYNSNMRRIASEINGEYIILPEFTSHTILTEFGNTISELIDAHRPAVLSDVDGDGLPDVCENKGIRLSNGKIIYIDPSKYDTDGDGTSDFIEVGGLPVKETYTVDGETYDTMVSRGGTYDTLSPEFIYVDGRVNADGSVIDEKMDYVSWSEKFYEDNYEKRIPLNLFGDDPQDAIGAAGVHGLYDYKMEKWSYRLWALSYYMPINNDILIAINMAVNQIPLQENSAHCFLMYIKGKGAPYSGCKDGATREYIPVDRMLKQDIFGINPAAKSFENHIQVAKNAAMSVLNEYNTDIYIALSPKVKWDGCKYYDFSDPTLYDAFVSLAYMGAFGTFNKADASLTLHCTYDPKTETYIMEYIYYLIDYYDFPSLDYLYEEDALGISSSYELFGKSQGKIRW